METTEVTEVSVIETALQKNNLTQAVINALKSKREGLVINGIEYKVGFGKMDDLRKEAKKYKALAVNICKAGREKAIQEQAEWIAKQKEISGEFEAIEESAETECNKILEEEKRILFEAAQAKKLPARKEQLMAIGTEVADEELLKINDEQFIALFNDLNKKYLEEKSALLKAEEQRLEAIKQAEEAKQKAEADRVAKEKAAAELAAKAKADAEAKVKAEMERKEREAKQAIEKAEREKEIAIESARRQQEKAEQEKQAALLKAEEDKKAAIAELERKQKEKEAAELKAKKMAEELAEQEKQAAFEAELSKGDVDKFADLIISLTALKTKYTFKSKKYQKLQASVNILLDKTIDYATNK